MTRDAFYKAQELDDELNAIISLEDIINNSTLSGTEEYKGHDTHVIKDKMILCYMSHNDIDDDNDVEIKPNRWDSNLPYVGKYELGGRIFGKDIPVALAKALMQTLRDYRAKIEKEFDALSSDYESED